MAMVCTWAFRYQRCRGGQWHASALYRQCLADTWTWCDGLPPSGGSPSPYYIFESEDDVKYYITNEDEACGRGTAYLTENADGTLAYCAVSTDELVGDDAFAWHLVFNLKHVIICCVMPSPASTLLSRVAVSRRQKWPNLGNKKVFI